MQPRIHGRLQHTSSSGRLRIYRTPPSRLCIAQSRYCIPGERMQTYLRVERRRFGTIQGSRYKAGYSPSSSLDPGPGTRCGIARTSVSTANIPLCIAQLFDLKSSSDPPFLTKLRLNLVRTVKHLKTLPREHFPGNLFVQRWSAHVAPVWCVLDAAATLLFPPATPRFPLFLWRTTLARCAEAVSQRRGGIVS